MTNVEVDTRASRWNHDAVFSSAWAYDLAFAWDAAPEIRVVLGLAQLATGEGSHLLLPACGTGRYAHALAQLGFHVSASDINEEMLALARAERSHPRVSYAMADMTRRLPGEELFDAAFTFNNSFRYILDEADVRGHLEAVYQRLRPGAAYVIDLGLTRADDPCGQGARWTVRHGDRIVRASWTLQSVAPPLSLELARIVVEEPDGAVHEVVAEQPQRIWSFTALAALASSVGFRVSGAHRRNGATAPDPSRSGRYYVVLVRPL